MSISSEFSTQKPSFSQKCSLLSQYLKEKGSFGDLSLGMACKIEPSTGAQETATTTMDLFPQKSGFMCYDSKDDVSEMADSRPETAQMTIFYGGRVIVFDDLAADQAKEIMLLANQGSSQTKTIVPAVIQTSFAPKPVESPVEAAILNPPRIIAQRSPQAVVCDLPIARRASLHRFLEKRKDRVTAKPYQANNPSPAESKPWLGLTGESPEPFHC